MITLYDYFRSSASFRVRIALNYKELAFNLKEVHLVNNGGEQHQTSYKKINPQGRVPTLVDDDHIITQSLAIIEYLEEKYPDSPLLPKDTLERAHVRAFAYTIVTDIHPLDNLAVLQYLKTKLNVSDEQKATWYAHWIKLGFQALAVQLEATSGLYSFDNNITLADICLVPQVYNANRFAINLDFCPKIQKIYDRCMQLDIFSKSAPESIPDIV